ERHLLADAGVVHQHVDAAPALHRRRDGAVDLVRGAHVGRTGPGRAELLRRLLERLGPAPHEHHVRALRGEAFGDRAADALARARDDRVSPLEASHCTAPATIPRTRWRWKIR